MRTTLTLDDDVAAAAKALAQASGKRFGKIISHLARQGLRTKQSSSSKQGLPVFKVPLDAPVIPSGRARELLAEQGL
jgi:hypothetical protein